MDGRIIEYPDQPRLGGAEREAAREYKNELREQSA